MLSKIFNFFLSVLILIVFSGMLFGQTVPFFDNFDSYSAGQQLACQNSTDWSTWSQTPCDPIEDAYISNAYAYSDSNSVIIAQNNDLIKPLGTQTSGKWDIGFMVYLPTGKGGYFNCMSAYYSGEQKWAFDAYFDPNGVGRFFAGSNTATTFSYLPDTWQAVRITVDLDSDIAQFSVEGVLIYTWQWTLGHLGDTSPLQLDVIDFYGVNKNSQMYIDNLVFGQYPYMPVELTSFAAVLNSKGVELNWSTATELNNYGFEIQRKALGGDYSTVAFVKGHGTTTQKNEYSFVDKNLDEGKYSYRLKQVDMNGEFEYSNTIEVEVITISSYSLEQNFPNPFNPSTTINYGLKEKGDVRITLLNSIGEEVAILVNEVKDKGYHKVEFDGSKLSSGVYFYKLVAKDFVSTKKMILQK